MAAGLAQMMEAWLIVDGEEDEISAGILRTGQLDGESEAVSTVKVP